MSILTCSKCGKTMADLGCCFMPIEPKGTPNRKWACEYCASADQKARMLERIGKPGLDVCQAVDPCFLQRGN